MYFRYLVPCLLFVSACSSTPSFETADQMQHYLTERIPVGTPIEQAKQTLKTEGFKVSPEMQEKPLLEGDDRIKGYTSFVFGHRIDGFIFVREWQIEMYFRDGKVMYIYVLMLNAAP